jgi:hypothetical protein
MDVNSEVRQRVGNPELSYFRPSLNQSTPQT